MICGALPHSLCGAPPRPRQRDTSLWNPRTLRARKLALRSDILFMVSAVRKHKPIICYSRRASRNETMNAVSASLIHRCAVPLPRKGKAKRLTPYICTSASPRYRIISLMRRIAENHITVNILTALSLSLLLSEKGDRSRWMRLSRKTFIAPPRLDRKDNERFYHTAGFPPCHCERRSLVAIFSRMRN